MNKGISPLVASVLLIAITMAVAAILANWVTGITETTLQSQTCIGGYASYVTADYPKWDGDEIIAAIEVQYVPMGDFKFVVIYDDDTVETFDDTLDTELSPGAVGTIKSGDLNNDTAVREVRISTNCSNVYIDFTSLR